MAGPLDKVIHPIDQKRIMEAIASAERMCSGEIMVHIEGRCPHGDPQKRVEELVPKLGVTRTRERNAVLVYAATRDRRFAFHADIGIGEEPSSRFWDDARQRMTLAFRRGAFGDGLCSAILTIGAQLGKRFPRQSDDKNELENEISTDEACR
jgi:uncharacterized membrane protein